MQKRRSLFSKLIIALACLSVLMLWFCALSSFVSPQHFKLLGVITLAFPFFLAFVLFMQLMVLLFAKKYWWVPLLGMACCFVPISTYFPINKSSEIPEGSIKVLSYNVLGYGNKEKNANGVNAVADYIVNSGASIVCLQEAFLEPIETYKEVTSYVQRELPYYDTLKINGNLLSCYSKYQIIGKEHICKIGAHGSCAFLLKMPDGDTLRVVNCHLRSMNLSHSDRATYRNIMHASEEVEITDTTSRRLISKICNAAVARAVQTDMIVAYLKKHKGEKLILCGDFNDSPLSYTHQSFRSQGLADAYASSGRGLGRSYNRDAIIVRIDHILYSDHWKAYGATVDKSIKTSDHYPIYTYLKEK